MRQRQLPKDPDHSYFILKHSVGTTLLENLTWLSFLLKEGYHEDRRKGKKIEILMRGQMDCERKDLLVGNGLFHDVRFIQYLLSPPPLFEGIAHLLPTPHWLGSQRFLWSFNPFSAFLGRSGFSTWVQKVVLDFVRILRSCSRTVDSLSLGLISHSLSANPNGRVF